MPPTYFPNPSGRVIPGICRYTPCRSQTARPSHAASSCILVRSCWFRYGRPPTAPEILMLRQYRLALDATILELPAGTRGWQEPWQECAQRELREETGFRAAHFSHLGQIWPAPGLTDEVMHLVLAQDLTADPLPGDVDETIEVIPMPLSELIEMAQDGRLQDAKSVVALWRTAVYIQHTPLIQFDKE
ncbi:MAG: NUDIX hydrolase [Anaerolineae bacterium]|nr:NUDIX hydrolase [Anaerolineae bacterium]